MSEETAAVDHAIAALAEPAAQPPEPPSPPASPSLQPGPEFRGRTFAFNLRDALIDLNFTVTPDVDSATFAAVLTVAVAEDGRIGVAVAKPDDPRNADEHVTITKARTLALEALGIKSN